MSAGHADFTALKSRMLLSCALLNQATHCFAVFVNTYQVCYCLPYSVEHYRVITLCFLLVLTCHKHVRGFLRSGLFRSCNRINPSLERLFGALCSGNISGPQKASRHNRSVNPTGMLFSSLNMCEGYSFATVGGGAAVSPGE